ncbi:kinesin, variant 2 [Capsaspora owczarzaki ATCC 30864]|nr:kinesin, variant 1 [Capsaspora owczarzaki ATCC 30864]KJE90261.1 kinesin, variant 2 [Capsaspora owczarzaki ATCC 30864]
MSNVRVVVRFRPQNGIEAAKGGAMVVKFDPPTQPQQSSAAFRSSLTDLSADAAACRGVTVDEAGVPQSFAFDRVFDPLTSQQQVYEYAVKSIVEDVLKGYNGTVFAYGQTSSGKTFTMEGPDIDDERFKGVIPRIIENMFDYIESAPEHLEFTVKVSYFEIYLEKIRDLLDTSKDNLQIHEDRINGVHVKGVTEVYVANPQEVLDVMKAGKGSRAVSHTQMNADSSRSHSVFMVVIQQRNLTTRTVRTGKLCLVDLAGSEKIGKTGAAGQTLEEAKKINKSLSALGNVINALTDPKATHVPYRDSKLTRVLQESLGGNARTTIIINCSPSSYNVAETISSLRFGTRAKRIKNNAIVNQELSADELRKRLEKAKAELLQLKGLLVLAEQELSIWRAGGHVAPSNYAILTLEAAALRELTETLQDDRNVPISTSSSSQSLSALAAADQPPSLLLPHSSSSHSLAEASRGPSFDVSRDSANHDTQSIAESTISGMDRPEPNNSFSVQERDELLRHENELLDQIQVKEQLLLAFEEEIKALRIEALRVPSLVTERDHLYTEVSALKRLQERAAIETNELELTIESLTDANKQLAMQLQLQQEATDLTSGATERRIAKETADRLGHLIASVKGQTDRDPHVADYITRQLSLDDTPESQMQILEKALQEKLNQAKHLVVEREAQISANEARLEDVSAQLALALRERETNKQKINSLEDEVSSLLNKVIHYEEQLLQSVDQTEKIKESRESLNQQLGAHMELFETQTREMRASLDRKQADVDHLTELNRDQKAQISSLTTTLERERASAAETIEKLSSQGSHTQSALEAELESLKTLMSTQQREFETLRNASVSLTAENKRLLIDIAGQCKKVVELEMALDSAHENFEVVVQLAGKKEQNRRVIDREAKIRQLQNTLKEVQSVQSKLIHQNEQLANESTMNKKLLTTRTERVMLLQGLLNDKEESLRKTENENLRLRDQLALLQQGTLPATSSTSSSAAVATAGGFSATSERSPASIVARMAEGPRVAKPIRGGGLLRQASGGSRKPG